jgi:hypothetical protein
MAKTKALICPYCGVTQPIAERCRSCGGLFEPLSRQATHNAMGPWFVRDPERPFQPGCSYETLVKLIERRHVNKLTIIRGPTTRQFWTIARRVPGIAHLLGHCHECDASVDPDEHACHACGAQFGAYLDRNYMGLPEVRALPWEARIDDVEPYGLGDGRGRLSRFASDEELLAAGALSAEAAVAAPARGRMGEEHAAPRPLEDHAASALTRALQRRIEGQKRSIRLLAVLVAVLAVVALLSNAASLFALFQSSPQTPAGAESAQDTPPAPAQETPPPFSPPARAIEAPASPKPTGPTETEPDRGNDRYDEALQRLVTAEQAERPLNERIADYEHALSILRELAAAPPETQPAGIGELVDRCTRELERLRLRDEFFGE